MRVNVQRLKGKIVENGTNVQTLAKNIGVDSATFYRKLREEGETFTVGEAHRISDALSLSKEDCTSIFFADSVA